LSTGALSGSFFRQEQHQQQQAEIKAERTKGHSNERITAIGTKQGSNSAKIGIPTADTELGCLHEESTEAGSELWSY